MLDFKDLKQLLNEDPPKTSELEQAKIEYIKAKTENEKRKNQPPPKKPDIINISSIIAIISIITFLLLQLVIVILIIKN